METTTPFKAELEQRIAQLIEALNHSAHHFDTALIVSRVNQYYLTGTMQDGILMVRRDGTVTFYVKKSAQRARRESPLPIIREMNTYRDILKHDSAHLGSVFIETRVMTVEMLERLKRTFVIDQIHPIEDILASLRTVKSPSEIALIREAGRRHSHLLELIVPRLMQTGISEAEFLTEIYAAMIRSGHHGVSRFAMFQMEMSIGQVGFGDSSIFPTSFDGPGGMRGLSAAVPSMGSRTRLLKRGDLVFVDVGFGIAGYHSDKTRVYSFGSPPPEQAVEAHQACLEVLHQASGMLKPGAVPSEIFRSIMQNLPPVLHQHFMGFGKERVKFLGHGVGLQIDEPPVIAHGFNQPLPEHCVIALEPKRGIPGVGMVGVEETYLITSDGPECLTGGAKDILIV